MTTQQIPSRKTIGELVAERPERGRVFERLGIDYCCGGRKSIDEACAKRGLDPSDVRAQLDAADSDAGPGGEPDWTRVPLGDLVDHIQTAHHQLMRNDVPRAAALVRKVAGVHGEARPELVELDCIFAKFARDLMLHMQKEDSVLFPWIRSLEQGAATHAAPSGALDQPVQRMMHDHDDAGEALRQMRSLTDGFTPPLDACGTYRVMLTALREIEADMHIHVHKENNILFPRALALEATRRSGAPTSSGHS